MQNLWNTLIYGPAGAFVWSENISRVVITALLSMVPTFEGRYALAVAQAMGMPAIPAFIIALVCSTIPMLVLLPLLRPVLDLMYKLPIGFVRKIAAWVDARAQRKVGSMDKKGLLGLYIFVALPLPGTGVWTGSLIATFLKMNKKHAAATIFLGNLTACLIMTVLTYLGVSIFS